MQEIGEFNYPDRGTFQDALKVAQRAINDFGGIIPNIRVTEELGYNIKNPAGISGFIYKRFDDFCMFGLTIRERGVIRTTDLAEKALDPTDTARSAEGKAEAIRKIHIVAKAYDEWNGEIPSETAFPAKITQLTSVSWIEAQKHVEPLRKLFTEVFPYLRVSPEISTPPSSDEPGARALEFARTSEQMQPLTPSPWLEAKVADVYIRTPRSKKGLETARKLLELMELEIQEEEETAEEENEKAE